MQDIEAITERIILIDKGRILLDGTLKDIKKDSLSFYFWFIVFVFFMFEFFCTASSFNRKPRQMLG